MSTCKAVCFSTTCLVALLLVVMGQALDVPAVVLAGLNSGRALRHQGSLYAFGNSARVSEPVFSPAIWPFPGQHSPPESPPSILPQLVHALIDPQTRKSDLMTPGHLLPQRSKG
jgi:hypothetical protein